MVKIRAGSGSKALPLKSVNAVNGLLKAAYVYIVFGAGLCKVGITDSIQTRFKALQSSSPVKLKIIAYWPTATPRADERLIHCNLSSYHSHGEWFKIPEDVVEEIVTDRVNVTDRRKALHSYLYRNWRRLFDPKKPS